MIQIIKSAGNSRAERYEAADEFVEVGREIENQLDRARHQAAKIIAEAEAKAEAIRLQATRQGQREAARTARSEVEQEVERRLATAMPALEQAIRSVEQQRCDRQRDLEQQVVQLAVAIASKLVRDELAHQPEIPLRLLREALNLAAGSQRVIVRLNPVDLQLLESHIAPLLATFREGLQAEVVADPEVSRGGCLVQSEFGCIDQRFETQLARIQQELT